MEIYLGLGSNLGDRIKHLKGAVDALARSEIVIRRVSPFVESPALLPEDADPEWNRPYLNLALRADTELSPVDLLAAIKRIEASCGRSAAPRWSPRTIDIDILLYGRESISLDELRIPHAEATRRNFVITPLVALDPMLSFPGTDGKTVLELSREIDHQIPLWMGIVNLTPDSFSDGNEWTDWTDISPRISEMFLAGTQLVDIGAESTRPGATALAAETEWSRLEPVLEPLLAHYAHDWVRPRISIDTYHPETARRALELGVDVVNDVSGLTQPQMIELAQSFDAEWIAMHQLSLPVRADATLPPDVDPVRVFEDWIEHGLERWSRAGLDLGRLYADPGIGFGKSSLQSLRLLRSASQYRRHGVRILIGHSRKSFMGSFATQDRRTRDLVTIGSSLNLAQQGVDVLRVHNPLAHIAAYRGWAHLR
jgi:2-amino-4-hydroxy-6-hydroxymethyldihydropteridine diphosphokinase/dihydropteroate synthase